MQENKAKRHKNEYNAEYMKKFTMRIPVIFNSRNESDNTLFSRLEYYCQINNISKNQAIKEAIEAYLNAKEY